MSLATIEQELTRFALSDTPEAVCIMGKWGVGKTFTWNRLLKSVKNRVKLPRYSYVSLFGINALDELKYAIFENSIASSDIGVESSLETLKLNTRHAAGRLGRKGLWFFQQLPIVKNHIGGLGPVWYLSIKNHIICFDDIERKGAGLLIRDLFGIISQLKEQRSCKIVLILNYDVLKGEQSDFDAYFDKTIDVSLKFEPTPQESAKIALASGGIESDLITKNCLILGISNIRIIKRIERLIASLRPILANYDDQVFISAVHTLTLLAWSRYEPGFAPPFEFIKNRHKRGWSRAIAKINKEKEEEIDPDEARWNSLLDAYEFWGADEFDLVLNEGIADGFFNQADVEKQAIALDRRAKAGKSEKKAAEGWRLFHESFASNEREILAIMTEGTRENVEYITPINFNGTITFLRQLGCDADVENLIREYTDSHTDDPDFFDLSKYPFAEEITDVPLRAAFTNKLESLRGKISPKEAFLKFRESGRRSANDLEVLANLPVDEYYNVFKNESGDDLRQLVESTLQIGSFPDATDTMKEITNRAVGALRRIAAESPINRFRIRRYGVEIETEGSDHAR